MHMHTWSITVVYVVERHFSAAAKSQCLEMVELLRESLRERIKELEWMSDSTKVSGGALSLARQRINEYNALSVEGAGEARRFSSEDRIP